MFTVLDCHDDAQAWRDYLRFLSSELQDVHITPEWGMAHEGPLVTAHLAVYMTPGFLTCQPFLWRQIGDHTDITCAGYGGPVSSAWPSVVEGAAFNRAFTDWRRQHNVVTEFYLINPLSFDRQEPLLAAPLTCERNVTILPVGTVKEFGDGMRPNRVQSMHKVDRERIVVDGVDPVTFALIYNAAMERKQAPERWRMDAADFKRLMDNLGSRAAMLGVGTPEKLHAVALFIGQGDTAYYHLAARAADGLSGYADCCITSGMGWAKGRGCKWLHLGGGLTAGDTLEAYKRSFGGAQLPVYSVRRVHDGAAYARLTQAHGGDQASGFFPAYRQGEAK